MTNEKQSLLDQRKAVKKAIVAAKLAGRPVRRGGSDDSQH